MLLVCLTVLSVSSCASTQKNDYCLIASVIRPTTDDIEAISDDLVAQIVAHNMQYQEICGSFDD